MATTTHFVPRSTRSHGAPRQAESTSAPSSVDATAETTPTALRAVGAAVRVSLGWVFLWAFLDKAFGLGHETASKDAWINGGHPTYGFLKFAAAGPFKGFYNSIAGQAWADWLFMIGLLAIGAALMLGVFMRLAAVAGVALLVMMWTAVLPPENNPFMDDHLIYAGTLVLLALLGAGRWFGLGALMERIPFVKRFPILR